MQYIFLHGCRSFWITDAYMKSRMSVIVCYPIFNFAYHKRMHIYNSEVKACQICKNSIKLQFKKCVLCISSHLSYFSAISAISPFLSAISLLPHSLPSGKHLFSVSVTLLLSRYENTGQLRARESDWTTSCTKIHSKRIKDFKLET